MEMGGIGFGTNSWGALTGTLMSREWYLLEVLLGIFRDFIGPGDITRGMVETFSGLISVDCSKISMGFGSSDNVIR